MFKRLVTLVRGLMGCQSTGPSSLTVEQHSLSAKPLRAKSTQASQDAQAPAKSKPKRKPKAASQTTQVKSRKAAQKAAQTTPGNRGQSSKTPVPQTQSPAPTQRKPKQEAAPSTTVAAKPGKKRPTVRQVAMVSQSKPIGSKSKTPVSKTHQPVSPVQTSKRKAAASTSAGKKATRSKTAAQTPMGNQSKARGS
jgi:hypothetical protein